MIMIIIKRIMIIIIIAIMILLFFIFITIIIIIIVELKILNRNLLTHQQICIGLNVNENKIAFKTHRKQCINDMKQC